MELYLTVSLRLWDLSYLRQWPRISCSVPGCIATAFRCFLTIHVCGRLTWLVMRTRQFVWYLHLATEPKLSYHDSTVQVGYFSMFTSSNIWVTYW